MVQAAYLLDSIRRDVVLRAIREVCLFRGWGLLAAHVRTNHVHVVVEAECLPEGVMQDFKAYSSRALNGLGIERKDGKRWALHGSTRWLFRDLEVQEAVRYVVYGQGETMAVYLDERL